LLTAIPSSLNYTLGNKLSSSLVCEKLLPRIDFELYQESFASSVKMIVGVFSFAVSGVKYVN
jgi:hypothetical protein